MSFNKKPAISAACQCNLIGIPHYGGTQQILWQLINLVSRFHFFLCKQLLFHFLLWHLSPVWASTSWASNYPSLWAFHCLAVSHFSPWKVTEVAIIIWLYNSFIFCLLCPASSKAFLHCFVKFLRLSSHFHTPKAVFIQFVFLSVKCIIHALLL